MKKLLFCSVFLLSITVFGQLPTNVPVSGLVGYWPFNGNANDMSGHLNNGIVSGAVLATGRDSVPYSAYSFDEFSYNDIEITNATGLSGMSDLTISVWLSLGHFNTSFQSIVTKWQRVNDCGSGYPAKEYLTTVEGSQLYLATTNNTLGFSNPYTLGTSDLNHWRHFVFTQNSQGQAIYVDAVLSATNAASGQICSSNINLLFGASRQGAAYERFFSGKMDDIGIWNRRLSDCEIKKLYSANSILATSASGTLICSGETVTLSASGAQSYSWNTTSTSPTVVVMPQQNTTYSVIGNYGNGCADTLKIAIQVAECTGIQKETDATPFSLGPNPGNGLLNCNFPDKSFSSYRLSVEDISGKVLVDQTISAGAFVLDLQHLNNGLYLLKVKGDQHEIFLIKKILIQK